MRKYKWFAFILVFVLLFTGCQVKEATKRTTKNRQTGEVQEEIVGFHLPSKEEEIKRADIKNKTHKYEGEKVSIDISYPQLPGQAYLNKRIEDRSLYYVKSIMELEDKPDTEAVQENAIPMHYFTTLTYQVRYYSERFVSIEFQSVLFTGGEHAENIVYSKNFDLEKGREVKLIHILENISCNQLKEIALKSIPQEIKGTLVEKDLKEWVDKNNSFCLEEGSSFPTYYYDGNFLVLQIAVPFYLEGVKSIPISLEELREFLY